MGEVIELCPRGGLWAGQHAGLSRAYSRDSSLGCGAEGPSHGPGPSAGRGVIVIQVISVITRG